MRAFVITIMNNEQSYKAAERCIRSGKRYDVDIMHKPAYTPRDNPRTIFKQWNLPIDNFLGSEWSRDDNAMACFLSHYDLWSRCARGDDEYLILEHDAVLTGPVPNVLYDKVMSIGAPSYGKFNTPTQIGINPLTSKRYFPGAHAYLVKPKGAAELVKVAHHSASPTDVFLSLDNFPWLQEYYPWVAEARDSFTTIQKEKGCLAKHNYAKRPDLFELVEV